MMNSVELLKERLRATLSEPNHSTTSRNPEISGPEYPDAEAYQPRPVTKSKSANYGGPRERRARWINDKVRRNNIPSSTDTSSSTNSMIYPDCGSGRRVSDSGFEDQEPGMMSGLPQYHSADETLPRRQGQGSNNNEPLNYKNRWRYRGSRTTRNPFRTASQPFILSDIIDENDTEGDESLQPDSASGTLSRKNGMRNSMKNRHSPNHSPSSISSDSEGECENSHDPSSMLNSTNEQSDARRKQSIFFASYGVWSEESVMKSIRDLSPVISSVLEAAWCGQVGTLEELLKNEENLQNINCLDAKGRTPLHLAAACGHAGAVELLLQKGAQVDPFDAFEKATPLMCAAASASLASVEILLASGANVNAGFDVGKTPLHWAVQAGSLDCAKRLLDAGAKQNPPLVYSENPLHIAASTGDAALLQLLLDYGADASLCKGTNRSSCLHLAAEEGNAACIRVLLKAGASHEAKDARGHTPLHVASSIDAESTGALLAAGADPNASDRDGRTPLHCSVSRGSRAAECVRLLVENQAEINSSDIFGFTPLHLAAVNESSQCASILLRHGADVTAKNKAGTTALSLLVRKIPDVMRFLVDRLDGAVTIHDHEPGDPDCEIRLDFRAVVPNSDRSQKGKSGGKIPEQPYYHNPRKETEFLTCVLAAGYKKILSHPLSEAFLTLKWQRVRKFFWASLLFQVALILLFTVYVIEVYLIKCPARGIPFDVSLSTTAQPPSLSQPDLNISPFKINLTDGDPPDDSVTAERRKRSTSNFSPFSFNPTSKPKNKKERGGGGSGRVRNRTNSVKGNSNTNEIGLRSLATPKIATKSQASESDTACTTCEYTNTEESEENDNILYRKQCHSPESWLTVIWCLLIAFTAMMAIKEAFQLLQSPFQYVLSSENWGQWALITSVLIAAWPNSFPDPDRKDWQYPAAAFGMFLAWGLMLLQVGRFPALGLYVQMLGKVAANFGLVILAYACLLIAFALAFCVIFPGEPAYYSVPLALLKVLTMMVGEVDYESLFYDPEEPLLYPITAHVLHGGFVIIVTIVLMNLLVGLAVSDIQGLQKGAKLNRLSRQTALISRLESFIFSKKLQAILPHSVGLILQRSALLVPSSYNWSYYFRPNDPRDKRLSKELKQSSLRLAASRHSSRHTVKVHGSAIESRQQFAVVNNLTTETSLRRMEQRLDTLQVQMDTVLRTLSGQMESIMATVRDGKTLTVET